MLRNYSKYNWYVVTGGPSSGKTTVINELAKLGYLTFPEAARVFIGQEMAKGKTLKRTRGDEKKFQRKVFKMKVEIERSAQKGKIVFFDRGIPDSIAYYQICGLNPEKVLRFCKRKRYRKIFFLEQLQFKNDYARVENGKTVKKLNKLLRESYEKLGYEVIDIPAMPIKERVKKILSGIER